jgi:hypothetical protein
MEYYEEAINKQVQKNAPWYVVPADDKRCVVTLRNYLERMQKYTDIKEPELDEKVKLNFSMYKSQLAKNKKRALIFQSPFINQFNFN